MFAQALGIELQTIARNALQEQILRALQASHAYQIPSARDELPEQWRADKRLLQQPQRLLCVSTNGAGYDTVDVAACTDAGVVVVNQTGANAQSVAEATIGLMIDYSRRVTKSDRRLRTNRGFTREDLMGAELYEKTLGLVGIGQIGARVARIAQALAWGAQAVDLPSLLTARRPHHPDAQAWKPRQSVRTLRAGQVPRPALPRPWSRRAPV